jgi:CheY-like chemotaxis protein
MTALIKCLLIDDDLDDHEIFSMALEEIQFDFQLTSAYNATQALDMLKSGKATPDFIFLDLNMPRINGKQCLVEIKNIPRVESIPVIIYSTSSEIKDLLEVQRLGAEAYIVKSSSIKDLVSALTDFFGNKVRPI